MKKHFAFLLLAALSLPAQNKPAASAPQTITHDQADEIIKELRQIRQLLEKQQVKPAAPQEEQPTRAKITGLSGVSMLGSKDAPHYRRVHRLSMPLLPAV